MVHVHVLVNVRVGACVNRFVETAIDGIFEASWVLIVRENKSVSSALHEVVLSQLVHEREPLRLESRNQLATDVCTLCTYLHG